MNCTNCGARLAPAENFCSACGTPVQVESPREPATIPLLGFYITAGPGVGRSFTLEEITRIGRSVDNEVRLYDPEVSREHAVVYRYEQGFAINDLGSANGTWVNGKRIGEAVWLRAGDAIQVGVVKMQVTVPGMPLVRRAHQTPSGAHSPGATSDVSGGSQSGGGLPVWLLWTLMGFGMLLAAAGVVGLIFVLGG